MVRPTQLTVLLLLPLAAALAPARQPDTPAADYPHLVMGNPSAATADPEKPENFLMKKPYYAVGYKDGRGRPSGGSSGP